MHTAEANAHDHVISYRISRCTVVSHIIVRTPIVPTDVIGDVERVSEKWKDVPDCSASRKEHINSGLFFADVLGGNRKGS